MGQTLMKLTPGKYEERKTNEILKIAEECYDLNLNDNAKEIELPTFADFYQAVSVTVEAINKKFGNTQFTIPDTGTLCQAYENHHKGRKKSATREEFQKILKEVIRDTGFTGMGAKDILIYIFGVPLTTLLMKQQLAPRSIPNEFIIPGITSLTVFALAKLNKI